MSTAMVSRITVFRAPPHDDVPPRAHGGARGGRPRSCSRRRTLWRACMNQVQQWARLRARTTCPLRRGAWYRVVQLTDAEAILDVNGRPLSVPRAFLQVLPIRPRMWSVVLRLRGAVTPPASWGPRYGVCPRCCARAPLHQGSATMRCPACGFAFVIGWADSHWRVFEPLSGSPGGRAIGKAREAAVRLWSRAAPRRSG